MRAGASNLGEGLASKHMDNFTVTELWNCCSTWMLEEYEKGSSQEDVFSAICFSMLRLI